jgi:hypothetical protein
MSNINNITNSVYSMNPSVEPVVAPHRFYTAADSGVVLSYIFTIIVFVFVGVVCYVGPTSEVHSTPTNCNDDEELSTPPE